MTTTFFLVSKPFYFRIYLSESNPAQNMSTLDADSVVGVNLAKAKSSRNYYTVWG